MQSSEEQIQENIRNVVGSHGEDLVDALLRAINIIKQRFMRVDKFLYYRGPEHLLNYIMQKSLTANALFRATL
jgi:hypothetical protein